MTVNNTRLASRRLDVTKAARLLERLKGYDELPETITIGDGLF
jgi:hypothetical protein